MAEDEFPPESDASGRLLIKRCPDCAELVQAEAHSCRYCRFDFDTGIGAGERERADPGEPGIIDAGRRATTSWPWWTRRLVP